MSVRSWIIRMNSCVANTFCSRYGDRGSIPRRSSLIATEGSNEIIQLNIFCPSFTNLDPYKHQYCMKTLKLLVFDARTNLFRHYRGYSVRV